MKKNIEFYPHYANSDQHAKFKMLRVQFGWEGEGKFWALNNRIAQSEDCCLNISKKYNKAALASDLDFKLDEFDVFINFLKNDCELITESPEGVITTDIIQEAFKKVMQDRSEARARYTRASVEKAKTSGEKIYKGKESKVKETYKSDSVEYKLADYLSNFILRRNNGFKKPNIQSWSKDIDLMLRIDGRKANDIKAVIEWCQKDDFWYKNILSCSKLRKQFDQLFLNMGSKKPIQPKKIYTEMQ